MGGTGKIEMERKKGGWRGSNEKGGREWEDREEEKKAGGCVGGREKGGSESAGEKGGMRMVQRAKGTPPNHEAESAYVTGEGGASGNVMKISEIYFPVSPAYGYCD